MKTKRKCTIGDKFFKLVIIDKWIAIKKAGNTYSMCKCLCECGKEVITSFHSLTQGHKKSCGCGRIGIQANNKNAKWTGYQEISGCVFATIKAGAKTRDIEFNITIEQIWDLFLKQDRKCAISGVDIGFAYKQSVAPEDRTASLDRIDSKLPYTIDNIQWVHRDINCMKMALSQEEFIFWCEMVAKYN